jgi:hypothetical protein
VYLISPRVPAALAEAGATFKAVISICPVVRVPVFVVCNLSN